MLKPRKIKIFEWNLKFEGIRIFSGRNWYRKITWEKLDRGRSFEYLGEFLDQFVKKPASQGQRPGLCV